MSRAQVVASTLQRMRVRLASLAGHDRIPAPCPGFADDRLGYFLPDDAGNPAPGRWCIVYSERGQDEVRATLDSEDDLLWQLFASMLQAAATGWELAHRIPHQDSRRAWFAKMAEWTAAYWPQWSARLDTHQRAILAQAPFDDDTTIFVEFLDTLTQPERRAVWALRGADADRFRTAVVDAFHAGGALPDLRQVGGASGLTLRAQG